MKNTFGPAHCKPHTPGPTFGFQRKAVVVKDDGGPTTFTWFFERGLLRPRMSAYELAEFVLGHMPHLLPWMEHHPRIYAEFQAIMMRLITAPKEAIDQVVPWIRSVTRTDDADIVIMSLFDHTEQPGPTYFVLSA